MKKKTRELAILAMLSAITILLGIVPNIGIIQIGPVAFTILHIPVIIASIILGIKGGLVTGLLFGITSWFVAVTRAFTPIDLLFVNPLISILPRTLFGLVAGIFGSLINKEKRLMLKTGVISFVSTLLHTTFVYVAFYLFAKQEVAAALAITTKNIFMFLFSLFSINALVEAAVATVVVCAVTKALSRQRKIEDI